MSAIAIVDDGVKVFARTERIVTIQDDDALSVVGDCAARRKKG
jgi:hypothetical protein